MNNVKRAHVKPPLIAISIAEKFTMNVLPADGETPLRRKDNTATKTKN